MSPLTDRMAGRPKCHPRSSLLWQRSCGAWRQQPRRHTRCDDVCEKCTAFRHLVPLGQGHQMAWSQPCLPDLLSAGACLCDSGHCGDQNGDWVRTGTMVTWLSKHTASGKVAAAVLRFPAGSGDFVVTMESELEHLSLWPSGAPGSDATELFASGQCRIRGALSGRGLREVRTGGSTEHRSLQHIAFPAQALGLLAAAASWAVGRAAVSVAVLEDGRCRTCSFLGSELCARGLSGGPRSGHRPSARRSGPGRPLARCMQGVRGGLAQSGSTLRHSCASLRRCRSQGGPLACAGSGIALGPRPSKFCAQGHANASSQALRSGRLYGCGFDRG